MNKLLFTILLVCGISSQSHAQSVTFNYTGAPESWTVPQCVTSIDVIVGGAEGGGNQIQSGTGAGGDGAVVTATFPVSPGDIITMIVGGEGGCGNNSGGFNGGGTGWASNNGNNNYNSCGGGGATELQINGTTYIIAAGGGGSGGGSVTSNFGGNGGCVTGVDGGDTYGEGGFGASQAGGGASGYPWIGTQGTPNPTSGSLGQGGNGGMWQTASGGGGGGGYYGGGGGGNDGCCTGANGGGGGGGGSSLVPAGSGCNPGQNTGDGFVTINYVGGLNPQASNNGPYCTGEDIELFASGGAVFNWTGPNGFTSNLQNPVISNSTLANAGTYTVTVTDPNCPGSATASTDVVMFATPDVNPIADQTVCHGDNTTAVTFSGSVGGTTFSWTNSNTSIGLAANGTGNIASFTSSAPVSTQTGIITVTPSTATCTGLSETFTITIEPSPTIIAGNDTTICENGTASMYAVANGGGGGPYLYYWGHTSNTEALQDVNPLADSVFQVYAESVSGCFSDTAYVNITLHPPLSGSISINDTVCPGYSTFIDATAVGGIGTPYTFTWSTGDSFTGIGADTIDVTPDVTTDYILTITDGCESTPFVLTTNVRVAPLPVPQYQVLDPYQCEPAIFHIVNTTDPTMSQYVYWELNGITSYLNQDTITSPEYMYGDYELYMMVTSYEGCIDSIRVEEALSVQPVPEAYFMHSPNPVLEFNTTVEFQNLSFLGYEYQWYFEEGYPSESNLEDPTVFFPDGETGEYEVTLIVTSELGCTDTMTYMLIVLPEILIYAPNTFTPDDDEYNQEWRVFMEGIDTYDFELLIYNRWGEVVWESHDINVGWDATYNGRPIEDGTYVWVIRTKDKLNDDKLEYKGHVNVLR